MKPTRKTILELQALPARATGADRSLDFMAAAAAGMDTVAGTADAVAKYFHSIARQLASKYADNPEVGKIWDDAADIFTKASDDIEAIAKRQPSPGNANQQQAPQAPAGPSPAAPSAPPPPPAPAPPPAPPVPARPPIGGLR